MLRGNKWRKKRQQSKNGNQDGEGGDNPDVEL
jgi:hypothetical protein